jgi:predicted alpha/beta-fold hydrolase
MSEFTPPPFVPQKLLHDAHLMTLAGALLPRSTPHLPKSQDRLFTVEEGTQMLAKCNWQTQPTESPTLVMVHGLEGSSESPYLRTLAEKGYVAGFNVLRVNQRNCGGTEKLTPTLYNSGLSNDFRAILETLIEQDGLREIFFAGYSMGGNLVLKMAGELGPHSPAELRGVCAVCPVIDLAVCVDTLEQRDNLLYQWNFVRHLKERMRRKDRLFPGQFPLNGLDHIRTVREFDDVITAPNCGYRDAVDYYARASASRVVGQITVPTVIVTAQDDPFVPFSIFNIPEVSANPHIKLVAPEHGGHCSFISNKPGAERYWAEARIVQFCSEIARNI